MKRIKSAPANLCEMVNRKKINNSQSNKIVIPIPIINKKYNIIIEEINSKNSVNSNYSEKNITKNDNSKIINTNIIEYNKFKSQKNTLKIIGTFLSDVIGDTNILPFEQNTLITSLINYFSENVLNKDKLKEIYVFILQAFARYLIILLLHSHFINISQEQPLLIENNNMLDLCIK